MYYNVDDDSADDDADDDGGDDDVRACAIEMHMDTSQKPFCFKIYWENAGRESRDTRLCEPAQQRQTWTCHKMHFVRNFTGKMPDANQSRGQNFVRACAVEMHMDMSQEAFYAEIFRDNAKRPAYYLD